jgi:hypothetical protein
MNHEIENLISSYLKLKKKRKAAPSVTRKIITFKRAITAD